MRRNIRNLPPMGRRYAKCLGRLTAATGVIAASHCQAATTRQWSGFTNDWNTANQWTPSGVPAAGDIVNVTSNAGLAFTCVYNYPGPAIQLQSLTVDLQNANVASQQATFAMLQNDLVAATETIGLDGNAIFNQSGGSNQTTDLGGNLILGDSFGAIGNYALSGAGNLSVFASEIVGEFGDGTMTESAGTNTVGGLLKLGAASLSNGTYILTGGTLTAFGTQVGAVGIGNFSQSSPSTDAIGAFGLQIGGFNGTYTQTAGSTAVTGPIAVNSGGSLSTTGGSIFTAANLTIAGGANGPASTTVGSSGSLFVAEALSVMNGGTLIITGGSTSAGSLSITGTGTANINARLAINFGTPKNDPTSTIVGYLQSGYNGGKWTGPGIASSAAAVNPGMFALGYADGNTDSLGGAAANQFLVAYTIAGDADLDGTVGFSDLVSLAQNFGFTGRDWTQGNFTYDPAGSIGFADLVLLAQNFGDSISLTSAENSISLAPAWQTVTASVPEPASMAFLLPACALLVRRRRTRVM